MENAEFILNEMFRQAELSPEERLAQEYNKMMEPYFIKRGIEYPDPEYLIEIGGVPTMPKGNLVAVSAKWKNGKTFFCSILTAIFMGSDQFASCCSLQQAGRALFFDTEQADTDTKRIQATIDKMTPENRHQDFDVYCLRKAGIDSDEEGETISRYEIIVRAIEHDHPDLVIIDGIADLIYNYNDVYESQAMVNKLATLAAEHNCCIVVVMHQNKGSHDKNMKGHLGTMLYQKASDVFSVEKHGPLFIATHTVSRHRNCEDIAFKLDANAVPMDAVADRQLQVELERQLNESKLREMLLTAVPEDGSPVKRSVAAELLEQNNPIKRAKAYNLLKDFVKRGWLIEVDRITVRLNTQYRRIDEQTGLKHEGTSVTADNAAT